MEETNASLNLPKLFQEPMEPSRLPGLKCSQSLDPCKEIGGALWQSECPPPRPLKHRSLFIGQHRASKRRLYLAKEADVRRAS